MSVEFLLTTQSSGLAHVAQHLAIDTNHPDTSLVLRSAARNPALPNTRSPGLNRHAVPTGTHLLMQLKVMCCKNRL